MAFPQVVALLITNLPEVWAFASHRWLAFTRGVREGMLGIAN